MVDKIKLFCFPYAGGSSILRADYKAVETYAFRHNNADLGCDISILNGKQDDITFFEIAEWNRHTSQNCKIHMFGEDISI